MSKDKKNKKDRKEKNWWKRLGIGNVILGWPRAAFKGDKADELREKLREVVKILWNVKMC